jgi:hypothetical protein
MKTLRFNIWNVIAGCVILVSTSCSGYLDDQISEEKAYSTTGNLYLNTVATLYNYIGGNEESQGLQGTYRGVYDLNTFTTDEAIIPTRGGDWYDGGFWKMPKTRYLRKRLILRPVICILTRSQHFTIT